MRIKFFLRKLYVMAIWAGLAATASASDGSVDLEYLQSRLEAHTYQQVAGDNVNPIPRGLVLKHVIETQLLSKQIVESMSAADSGQNPGLSIVQAKPRKPASPKSAQMLDDMCAEAKRQRKEGKMDGVALAKMGQAAQQQEHMDLERFYEGKLAAMSSVEKLQMEQAVNSNKLSRNWIDFVGFAYEQPDVVFSLIERGCQRVSPN